MGVNYFTKWIEVELAATITLGHHDPNKINPSNWWRETAHVWEYAMKVWATKIYDTKISLDKQKKVISSSNVLKIF